jgi:hypothetical protein
MNTLILESCGGKSMRTILALVATSFLFTSAGSAQTAVPGPIEACAALSRDSERLACFDKAVAALRAGQGTDNISAENMFGATHETVTGSAPGAVKREELKEISGTVTSLRRADDGKLVLELDNGQVWRQQDSDVRMMVAVGDKLTVVRASLGTFRIADKSGRFARFKRVR